MVKLKYMNKGILTYVFAHRCMHIGIWTKVYGHGYMDMGIWTIAVQCSVVYCFKCVALRCDSMLLGFVVGGCYGLVSRCFSERERK